MGYTTEFFGGVEVAPPLNDQEADYLHEFAGSRRMKTTGGPYFARPGDDHGQSEYEVEARGFSVIDYNTPPDGQPGLWCNWVPTEEGDGIVWDGSEKFYHAAEWMKYLIDHFLKPGAHAQRSGDPQFDHFTFDHVVNGVIEAQGEESQDRWQLVVVDNVVKVARGQFDYGVRRPRGLRFLGRAVLMRRGKYIQHGTGNLRPSQRKAEKRVEEA